MSSDIKSQIVPLNEKNYPTWKLQMRMMLLRDNLLSLVDGTEPPLAQDASAADRSNFVKRQNKALANLVLSIEPQLLYIVGDPTDPAEVWTKLQNTFQKKSWSNRLRLKKKLYTMKLKAGDSLQSHFKEFIEIFDELAILEHAIDDEDKVISLLASLPDKYSTLVTALEAQEKVPSWESVTQSLLHEEKKMSEGQSDGNKAMVGHGQNFNKNDGQSYKNVGQNFSKKEKKCFFCNKSGHIKKDCYKYKNSLSKNSNNSVNIVRDRINDNDDLAIPAYASTCEINNESWIFDSGATAHMCNNETLFSKLINLDKPISVKIGDGTPLQGTAEGDISLKLRLADGEVKNCHLSKVLFVPKLAYNLISVSQITDKGKKVNFFDDGCTILENNNIVATGTKVGKLYFLNVVSHFAGAAVQSDMLWHRRFCHLGIDNLKKVCNGNLVKGVDCIVNSLGVVCPNCCDGKIKQTPFPIGGRQGLKPLDLIHSDVCGKITPATLGNSSYFVTFIDHASRYTWVYVIKNKSDVFDTFKDWKMMAEKQYERKVKILRSDNGGEYVSKEFDNYLKSEGIIHEKSIPGTPQQNGIAERYNRTVIETVRCMISDSGLSKEYWGEALNTATYVKNRSPNSSLNRNMTPYEALNGRQPNVKHFKVFGSPAYVHVPYINRDKIDPKAKRCVFVGYGNTTKGYRLYDTTAKKIIYSKDVIFDEMNSCQFEKENTDDSKVKTVFDVPSENSSDDGEYAEERAPNPEPDLRRSTRNRNPPNMYGEWTCIGTVFEDPTTVKDALSAPESNDWKSAMEREMKSLNDHNVWDLVEQSKDMKLLNCKWIFKRKLGSDGCVSSYKARLVAQGYSQRIGIDYDDTFSPVVRFESIRTILSLAAKHGLKVHHMDVNSAFLNGELEEELFMKQPDGFVQAGKENYVCKLNKSLYGLKQASKCWNVALDSFLLDIGFVKSNVDNCVYVKVVDGIPCIVAVYVDDMIFACKNFEYLNAVKSQLSSKFLMKDLGDLTYFLGVNVIQGIDKITINQAAYVNLLLKKFGFEDCKPVATPADSNSFLEKATDSCELFDIRLYQSAVGALLYLSTRTRPDIAYAVSNVSKFCSNPTTKHWTAVKRIFRYLKGTVGLGISYLNNDSGFAGYADADWAGDRSDRKSTSGYCFLFNSGLISWRSVKQSCVALSSTEAEYVALSGCVQEALFLDQLLVDLKFDFDGPILVFEDNQSALCLAENSKNHPRTKHIQIKYHFVRNIIADNKIKVKYCPTELMLADIFTKALAPQKFINLRNMLGMN